MSEPLEALVVDLLDWIGPGARPYQEVLAAWRTSCPRLPVWEEATERGFVERRSAAGGALVAVTPSGRRHLESARPAAARDGATLRSGALDDLREAAGWIRSAEECRRWAGARLAFPIDLAALAEALELPSAGTWCLVRRNELLGLGQIVPKPAGRLHLARLIVSPRERGRGLGTRLARELLGIARRARPASISLNVDAGNGAALAVYRGLGFAPAQRPHDEPESPSLYLQVPAA